MDLKLLLLLFIGYQIYKSMSQSKRKPSSFKDPSKQQPVWTKNSLLERLSSLAQENNAARGGSSFNTKNSSPTPKEDYFSVSCQPKRWDRSPKEDDPNKISLFEVKARLFH
jgi:hypothetical protein